MKYSKNEVLAGAVILIAAAALMAFLIVVGKFGTAITGSHTYRIRFDQASLIRRGSPVAVNGIKLGQVQSTALVRIPGGKKEDKARTRVEIRFELPNHVPLRAGARGTIQSTITGIITLLVTQGSGEKPVPEDALIESYDQASLAAIGRRAEKFLAEVEESLLPVLSQLRKTADTFEKTAGSVKKFVDTTGPKLDGAAERIGVTVATYDRLGKQVESQLAGNRARIDRLIADLRNTGRNLDEFSRSVRRQPWRLLRKSDPPEEPKRDLVDAAREYSQGVAALNDTLVKLSALAEADPEDKDRQQRIQAAIKELEAALKKYRDVEATFWERLKKD